jgi:hypothetical protein
MTTRYKNVQIYVDPKVHKELKKKLKKKNVSLSQFFREKSQEEVSSIPKWPSFAIGVKRIHLDTLLMTASLVIASYANAIINAIGMQSCKETGHITI